LSGSIPGAFTSKTKDWILYFSISGLKYEQARRMESHIKKMKSREYIKNLNKFPELIQRLKNKYK
jgi:putative endonuclease